MEHLFSIAALWLALAVFSAIIAYHLRVSIALVEICVGVAVGVSRHCSARQMPWAPTSSGFGFWRPPGPSS